MDLQKEVAPLVAKKAFKSPLKAGPLTEIDLTKSKTVQCRSEKFPLCVQTKAKKAAAPMKAADAMKAASGYLLFATVRRRLAKKFGEDLDMADVGLEWRSLSASDQKEWKEEAAALREA